MSIMSLDSDEVQILEAEEVECVDADCRGMFANTCRLGTLLLTNKRVSFVWKSGILIKKPEIECIPLSEIKIFNGIAQVKASKPKSKGGRYLLTIYMTQGEVVFQFPLGSKKAVSDWVETINELITGVRQGFDESDVGGFHLGKVVSEAVSAAKPITSSIAEVAQPLIPVATAVASARFPGTSEVVKAISGVTRDSLASSPNISLGETDEGSAHIEQPGSSQTGESGSVNEQIEAMINLKKLLDAGALTQEEFDIKKKEIMGF